MKSTIRNISILIIVSSLLLTACGAANSASPSASAANPQNQEAAAQAAEPAQAASDVLTTSLAGYQQALEDIYTRVNPSVVSIRVILEQTVSLDNSNSFPFLFGLPGQDNGQSTTPQYSEVQGSGFVWDKQGDIVTNNHVVEGASKIEVMFADGTTVPATLVGADADSDLAVIKANDPGFELTPIAVNTDGAVKVGQVAIAIGNPFGLENTMTVGIVSAVERTISANATATGSGKSYSIPDIIQTDAPINPGNSGGPLVDDLGELIGVNTQIESAVNSSAGIGFAIPATIVKKVVPELIENGKYEHPWLGITGTTLTPEFATAMDLDALQRGALVVEVTPASPADKGGLRGSDKQATIEGQQVSVGGDVITAIDQQPVKTIEDIISYLANNTEVGQKISLSVLRGNKEKSIEVTLAARPVQNTETQTSQNEDQGGQGAWLGISVQPLTAEINAQMNLPENQSGLLVEQVQAGSPADEAGLQGSYKPVLVNNQRILIGGDVITAIDGKAIAAFDELQGFMQSAKPGQKVILTLLRDAKEVKVEVTLGQQQ